MGDRWRGRRSAMVERGHWMPRRLPAVPVPVPGESLHSWAAALARVLETSFAPVTSVLGLDGGGSSAIFRLRRAVQGLTEGQVETVAAATGLTRQRITELTLESYLSGVHADHPWPAGLPDVPKIDQHEKNRAAVIQRGYVLGTTRFRVCPACIGESDGRWPLAWLLPWFVVCLRHRLYMVDACVCGTGVRSIGCIDGDNWRCHGFDRRRGQSCGRRLRDLPGLPVTDSALVDAHSWLLQLLNRLGERGTAENVTPNDLFAVLLLCTERGTLADVRGLDARVREVFEERTRKNEATVWRAGESSRGYSAPLPVLAAGLRMAVPILAAADPLREARRVLPVEVEDGGVRAISDWLHTPLQITAMSLVGPRFIPLAACVLDQSGSPVPRTQHAMMHPKRFMSGWSALAPQRQPGEESATPDPTTVQGVLRGGRSRRSQ
ncbi:TniQ family protein [Kitasatospora sp. NPDC004723]|uniref:TniQ family protein n=1 Tax=Kitasatospora sp. NPDC004723 TaxID=3154288 RepID=UPI0033A5A1B1